MSRLNPHVASFPATGSIASNASSPNHSTLGHTSNASKSYANPTKSTSYATCAQSEIDLTHITPSKTDFTWPRGQVLPPITSSPSYGQRWNSTFPSPRKSYLPRSNTHLLSPQRSPVIRRSKSPSLPQLNSDAPFGNLIMEHAGVNSRVAPLPTHTMTRQPSPSIKTRFGFEPFADDDDLLKEAANARVATSPAPLSPARVESVSWKFAADTNVLRDDDEDIGHSRNVYIPNPPLSITESSLKKFGQSVGRVVSVKVEHSGIVLHDTVDQFPQRAGGVIHARRYAFVMFDSNSAAQKFIAGLAERGVPAQFGLETPHLKQKALEDPFSSNCYFADIPLDFTEEEMRALVHPAQVSSMRFLLDADKNRRGTAMVRMHSRVQAEEVIRRLDLKVTLPGCAKPVQVRIADSENQKVYKQNANRSRNSSGSDSNGYGLMSPMSSASQRSSQRSSSFGSVRDIQDALYTAEQIHRTTQAALETQQATIDRRGLNIMRPVIDVSAKLSSEYTSHPQANFASHENMAPRLAIGHGYPQAPRGVDLKAHLCHMFGGEAYGATVAPPPSPASSASTSHSDSVYESHMYHPSYPTWTN